MVRSQLKSAARGAVLYVVVGLGSALSVIATLVGLGTWAERVSPLILTAVVAFAALLAYYAVRRQQKDGDEG